MTPEEYARAIIRAWAEKSNDPVRPFWENPNLPKFEYVPQGKNTEYMRYDSSHPFFQGPEANLLRFPAQSYVERGHLPWPIKNPQDAEAVSRTMVDVLGDREARFPDFLVPRPRTLEGLLQAQNLTGLDPITERLLQEPRPNLSSIPVDAFRDQFSRPGLTISPGQEGDFIGFRPNLNVLKQSKINDLPEGHPSRLAGRMVPLSIHDATTSPLGSSFKGKTDTSSTTPYARVIGPPERPATFEVGGGGRQQIANYYRYPVPEGTTSDAWAEDLVRRGILSNTSQIGNKHNMMAVSGLNATDYSNPITEGLVVKFNPAYNASGLDSQRRPVKSASDISGYGMNMYARGGIKFQNPEEFRAYDPGTVPDVNFQDVPASSYVESPLYSSPREEFGNKSPLQIVRELMQEGGGDIPKNYKDFLSKKIQENLGMNLYSNPIHAIAKNIFNFGKGVGQSAGESVGESSPSKEVRGFRGGLAPFMMGMQNLGEEIEKQGFTDDALRNAMQRLVSRESLMSFGKSLIPYVAPAEIGGSLGENYLPKFIPPEYRYLGGFLGGIGAEAFAAPAVGTAMTIDMMNKVAAPWERMAESYEKEHPSMVAPVANTWKTGLHSGMKTF
jgi:hypothetical protein